MVQNNASRHAANGVNGNSAVNNANAIEGNQWRKWHTMQGHGFAAEDANALHDTLCGRKVEKVGVSNELNGADRIVDGVKVQTKYCRSAYDSVNAAFRNPDGSYAYEGQVLEVPSDQYEEAVKFVAEKIANGKVPGMSDPADAAKLVKKGSVTYQQAQNIARAGNIDSIWFDVKTQSIACASALGLSFVICYAYARYKGQSHGDAFRQALKQAAKSGVNAVVAGVITQQFLRVLAQRGVQVATSAVVANAAATAATQTASRTFVANLVGSRFGSSIASALGLNGARALARTNVVTGTVMTVVSSVPDAWKAANGRMSGSQLAKNVATNAAGVGAGVAGASYGAALGTAIFPGIGTVIGGLIGGLFGGTAGSVVTKKVLDVFVEDDYEAVIDAITSVTVDIAVDHSLSESQVRSAFDRISAAKLFTARFFEDAYRATKNDTARLHAYLHPRLVRYF